jgi:hypothetical protein
MRGTLGTGAKLFRCVDSVIIILDFTKRGKHKKGGSYLSRAIQVLSEFQRQRTQLRALRQVINMVAA